MIDLYIQYGTPVLLGILVAGSWLYMRLVHDNVKDSRLGQTLLRFGQELKSVIVEVNATYVDELKRGKEDDGKLDKEESDKAKKMAIAKLKENYGSKGIKRLAKVAGVKGVVDSWLGTQVESALDDMKKSKSPPKE